MDWAWLLVFAGLMFVMHRFGMGCCGGHGHKGHGEAPKADDKGRQEPAPRGGGMET